MKSEYQKVLSQEDNQASLNRQLVNHGKLTKEHIKEVSLPFQEHIQPL